MVERGEGPVAAAFGEALQMPLEFGRQCSPYSKNLHGCLPP
jgi:hypothetical protein